MSKVVDLTKLDILRRTQEHNHTIMGKVTALEETAVTLISEGVTGERLKAVYEEIDALQEQYWNYTPEED